MGTIRPSSLLGRLVDLDVLDDEVRGVEAFCVGVRFGVFEQVEEVGGGLLGPAGFADAELFACGKGWSLVCCSRRGVLMSQYRMSFKAHLRGRHGFARRPLSKYPIFMLIKGTHPVQFCRCSQHTVAWAQPPCALSHSPDR